MIPLRSRYSCRCLLFMAGWQTIPFFVCFRPKWTNQALSSSSTFYLVDDLSYTLHSPRRVGVHGAEKNDCAIVHTHTNLCRIDLSRLVLAGLT